MKKSWAFGLGLAFLALCGSKAVAQPLPPAPAGVPTTVPTTTGFNIFDVFDCSKLKKECKDCICGTPIGQMLNNMTGMAGTFTGGLIPPFCPPLKSAEDIQKLKDSGNTAAAAAEEIKKLEADAKARAAAMRFLGTVDCERFKAAKIDVPGELIKGLSDTNECVRLAAVQALGNGCCCNEDTIEALAAVASGSGLLKYNPKTKKREYIINEETGRIDVVMSFQILPEKCPRVREAARLALERCLCCYVRKEPYTAKPEKQPQEGTPRSGGEGMTKPASLEQVGYQEQREGIGMPKEKVLQKAEQALQTRPGEATDCGCGSDCSMFGLFHKAYHKQYKRQVIRTEILDVTKDCNGKVVPVGGDPNAVVQPRSRFRDNIRNMFAPVDRQQGQQGQQQQQQGQQMQQGTTQGQQTQPQGGQSQTSHVGQPTIYVVSGNPQVLTQPPVTVERQILPAQPVATQQPGLMPMTLQQPVLQKQPMMAQQPMTLQQPVMQKQPQVAYQPMTLQQPMLSQQPIVVERKVISTQPVVTERRVVPAQVTILAQPTQAPAVTQPQPSSTPQVIVQPQTSQPLPLPSKERRVVSYQLTPPPQQ
jgi:hypothetical protein